MRYRYMIIGAVLLSLTACSSKSNFYQLHPQVDQETSSRHSMKRAVIGIAQVDVAEYLKKSEMVTRMSAGRINVHETDRWAGSFGKNIQSVMNDNLSRLLPRYTFVSYPWEEPLSDRYRIYISISKFDGDTAGTVRLHGRWTLVEKEDDRVMVGESFTYTEPGGESLDAIVNTQSRLLEKLSRHIGQKVAKRL